MVATMTTVEKETLHMRRTFKANVERVYKAWTEPHQMSQWMGCGPTTNSLVTQDFVVGGEYKIVCRDNENELAIMSGTFLEIVPNKKLVYTWKNTSPEYPAENTIVTVEFAAVGDSTEIVLTHDKFEIPLSVEGHSFGWGDSFDKLAGLIE